MRSCTGRCRIWRPTRTHWGVRRPDELRRLPGPSSGSTPASGLTSTSKGRWRMPGEPPLSGRTWHPLSRGGLRAPPTTRRYACGLPSSRTPRRRKSRYDVLRKRHSERNDEHWHERRATAEATRRHALVEPVAQRLVKHRAGLDDGDEATYWLDEIKAVLPNCHTPTQLLSLQTYVRALVRQLRKTERDSARPAGRTDEARLAYGAAAELVAEA